MGVETRKRYAIHSAGTHRLNNDYLVNGHIPPRPADQGGGEYVRFLYAPVFLTPLMI